MYISAIDKKYKEDAFWKRWDRDMLARDGNVMYLWKIGERMHLLAMTEANFTISSSAAPLLYLWFQQNNIYSFFFNLIELVKTTIFNYSINFITVIFNYLFKETLR